MIPEKQKSSQPYEQIRTDDFVLGTIADVVYEKQRTFKGFQGSPDKVVDGVKFVFNLDGCVKAHQTRWYKMIWAERSNLFKFMDQLVGGISPNVRIDIDCVKGMKVKTLWVDGKDGWQNLDKIIPLGGKMIYSSDNLPTVDISADDDFDRFQKDQEETTPF